MNNRSYRFLKSVLILLFIISASPVMATELGAVESETSVNTTMNREAGMPQLAPVNPEFLDYTHHRGERGYLMSSDHHFVPGVVPSPIDFSHTKGMQIGSRDGDMRLFSTHQQSYDLRDEDRVSPVKDQRDEGNCWAFGTYASLESFFLPDEAWDFSENNMKNIINEEFDVGEGGNRWMSTAYLARWSGPVLGVDDPYEAGSTFSPEDLPPVKRVQNVLFLPERAELLDNENVKWALTEYGVVQISIFWVAGGWNPDGNAYYQSQDTRINHAVAIVGWDDNYPRGNFNTQPPGDGAFIVKNSWGTGWGDGGFFYLSYYDTSIKDFAVFTGEDTERYDRVYQHDPMGWVTSIGYTGSDTAWFANIFTADLDETISAVGFYTPVVNSSYQIDVYTDPDDGPRRHGGVVSTATGTIPIPGYHTIDMPAAALHAGQNFSVIVRLETPDYNSPIPIECPIQGYSSKATANPGESYVSPNGGTWTDLTTAVENANVCLKAYTTVSTTPVAAFSANTTSGYAPLTVAFTDESTGTPTAWYWDFGDGFGSRVQNPTHTYTGPGTYTVNLTVTNSQGLDSEVKTGHITIPEDVVDIIVSPNTSSLMVGETGEYAIILSYLRDGLGSFDIDINITEPEKAQITGVNITVGTTSGHSEVPAGSVNCWASTHILPETENLTIVTITIEALSEGVTNLTVTNPELYGYETRVIPAEIIIGDRVPPVAGFEANTTRGAVPLTVEFTDLSAGEPTGHAWYFGDENLTSPWSEVESGERWSARTGHAAVTLSDGSIVVLGGQDSNYQYKRDVWRSEDGGANWTQMTGTAGWSGRTYHTAVALPDDSIVLMGGIGQGSVLMRDVWRSQDCGATWTRLTETPGWSARYAHDTAVLPDGSIVLTGGFNNIARLNDTWRSTNNGTSWVRMTSNAQWAARYDHSSLALPDGSLLVIGGRIGQTDSADVWRSTDNGTSWALVTADAGWETREGHAAVLLPDASILLTGGWHEADPQGYYLNDTWRSTDGGAGWTPVADSLGWEERQGHTTVVLPDGRAVLMGGATGEGYQNDIWHLETAGSTEEHPIHTYTRKGVYDVTLRVYNAAGFDTLRRSGYITVTDVVQPPEADFRANRTIGPAPLAVAFEDRSTGGPTSWFWEFGDGTNSTEKDPDHTYTEPGLYTVSLRVANEAGGSTEIWMDYITAHHPASDMTIQAGPLNIATGMNGTIPISITNVTGAEEIICSATFEPAYVNVTSVAVNSSVIEGTDLTYQINNQTGTLNVTITRTDGNYTAGAEPVQILDITLQAKHDIGERQIGFGEAQWIRNGVEISFGRKEAGILNIHLRADFNRNNRIDIGDVAKVAWMAAGLLEEDLEADFDNNGEVDSADAAKIAYFYVGKIPAL